jgi:hypothetical protein
MSQSRLKWASMGTDVKVTFYVLHAVYCSVDLANRTPLWVRTVSS